MSLYYYKAAIAMAGRAPISVPTSDPDEKILSIADLEKAASKKLGKSATVRTSDPDEKILSIADLEKAASKKLGKSARGNRQSFIALNLLALPMEFQPPLSSDCESLRTSRNCPSNRSSREKIEKYERTLITCIVDTQS